MLKKNPWITFGLLAAIIAIFVISFVMAPKPSGDEEGFAGTDSIVSETLEDEGTEPWFQPIFEPGSGEIESGLFALQAALGAGIVGFALGNLRGRAKQKEELAAAAAASTSPASDAIHSDPTHEDEPAPAVE